MNLIIDITKDAVIDSLKILPFLFITYILMEYLEHKTEEFTTAVVQKTEHFGQFTIGSSISKDSSMALTKPR